nr:hypothetical protein [Tanacetum cinerariifolium]
MVRDSVQLETAVNTITHEYLLEFTSEYGITEMLRPELPGLGDRIVDFPEGKVGVYTRFFEFANFRLPLSQFLFDVLGYYQIHISQLSVIGVAKVSHFEISCRVQNIVPTLSLFRVFYVPSFNSGWMSFSKRPGKNTLQCYTKPLDSLKNWNNRFFWVDECVFPTAVEWRTNASKNRMPASGTYSVEAVRVLDTHRTPIQKQPEALLCLVGISRRYYLGDDVYPTFHYDDDRGGLIRAPNPTKVKTRSHPCAPHELPLLTLAASRVIEMDEPALATDSSGVPSAIEKSPLDFAYEAEASGRETAAPEMPPPEEVPLVTVPGAGQAVEAVVAEPHTVQESRKRGPEGVDANAPPKSLRMDHTDHPSGSSRGGKSLAAMQLCLDSNVFMSEGVPDDVSDPDPLAFADAPSHPPVDVAHLLDTPKACQDLVDHAAPAGYFAELRHMPNDEFLRQYNVNLARQVALRFEQEAKLLKKSVAQVARREKRIQDRELEIKNLEVLLETKAEMKRAAEEQVSGEEKLKAAFEEFKRYEDDRVEQWCAELDARLDALSIDFDKELYPHMLTA